MWGSKKSKIKSSKIDTLIGQGMQITGDIKFEGGLHLDGSIVGNAIAENGGNSVFVVSDKGRVEGDIRVSFAIINGEVIGNVYASEKLELSDKARITGDVHYSLLEMASGAEVNGKMVHESEKKLLEHHVPDVEVATNDDEHAQNVEPV